MMASEFLSWLLGVATTTGVLGAVGFFFRDTVAAYFSKSIEHRFEKRLEMFKGELRDNEKELEHIRSFLTSAQRDRDTAIQAKRLEAAETLMRARHCLSQLAMLVEYMKILNGEKILKEAENPKIIEFIEMIMAPLDVDGKLKAIQSFDKTGAKLYLSDRTLNVYAAYESIILQATAMMKLYSLPLREKGDLIKAGNLGEKIIEIAPGAKEGFDRFGEAHAYYWAQHFHDEILRLLRHEVSGADDLSRNAKSAEQLALESRQAQINVRLTLLQTGLPETILKTPENADAGSPGVESSSS
jgi:hypothetical protein